LKLEKMSREELARELLRLQEEDKRKEKERERLLDDLRVYQVELEVQNRELREAQSALEASKARFEELYDLAPVAYYAFDLKGCVLEVNLSGAAMVRRDRAKLIGLPFLALVRMPDEERFRRHLRRCTKERKPVVTEMRFSVDRGEPLDVQVASVPAFDPTGRPIALRTSFTDITSRKKAEAALKRSRSEEARLRKRYEDLDRASLAVTQALARVGIGPAGEVLQAITDHARILAGAEFSALGIGDDPERAFAPWVFSGIDPGLAAAIGRHPFPRGLLGEVVRTGRSIRLRDLREHGAFAGFPANHPEMRSFLGVPLRFGERAKGKAHAGHGVGLGLFIAKEIIELTAVGFGWRAASAVARRFTLRFQSQDMSSRNGSSPRRDGHRERDGSGTGPSRRSRR
jgi:PAS domain S-box-containing protein